MLWVIVFVAIALAGLIMLACYAVWLAHKTSDVWSEVSVLSERGAQLADLLGQIGSSQTERRQFDIHDPKGAEDHIGSSHRDVRLTRAWQLPASEKRKS